MATQPITCPYDVLEGFRFNRGNLVLDTGRTNNPQQYLSMSDLSWEIQNFARNRAMLNESSCYLLSQPDVADEYGFVSFIAIKAIFPSNIVESKKYLTWTYQGKTYYMGELMILSGKRISTVDAGHEGWNLSKPGTTQQDGGITFCNPHTDIKIRLEMLIGQ